MTKKVRMTAMKAAKLSVNNSSPWPLLDKNCAENVHLVGAHWKGDGGVIQKQEDWMFIDVNRR